LIEIVETLQESGARVIVGGLRFPLRDRGYGKAYAELAERTGAVLIPHILDGIMGNRNLMSDPIHPNDDGYEVMAGSFYKAVLDIL
jgi:lysophospholipase L1-like esterase